MRKKASAYDKELKAAAAELGLPRDHWQTQKLATLTLMFLVARSKWASGQSSNSSDMLALMSEITSLRRESKAVEPMQINIEVIKKLRGRCWHCGAENEVGEAAAAAATATPAAPTPANPTSHAHVLPTPSAGDEPLPCDALPADAPAPVSPDAPAKPATPTMKVTYREGVSASPLHSAVINGREVPPLRKFQPNIYAVRRVSPMSEG